MLSSPNGHITADAASQNIGTRYPSSQLSDEQPPAEQERGQTGVVMDGAVQLSSAPTATMDTMSRRFTGWETTAFDVLLELDGDPPAAVRQRWRKDRERLVRAPMITLLQDLADADEAYDDFTVEGFVSPQYGRWQHQYARIRIARNVAIDLAFDLDGLRLTGNWWPAGPDRLRQYRTAIAAERSGSELTCILQDLQKRGRRTGGNMMKRMPPGYPIDHPRADLLRHRSLAAELPLGCEDWLHTPNVVDHVLAAAAELRPFTSWFAVHVAAE